MSEMSRRFNRRAWLSGLGVGLAAGLPRPAAAQGLAAPGAVTQGKPAALVRDDFQPRSMLVVPEHPIERAKFPVVDM
jgi:hypothetical protein